MPRLLDSDCTFDVVLESDKGKTDPPTFVFRALSAREFAELAEMYDDNSGSDSQQLTRIVRGIQRAIVGWRHMGPHEFDRDTLDSIITLSEATEIMQKMLSGQDLSGDDLKN